MMKRKEPRWKTISMAVLLAMTGGALGTAHHTANASHVRPDITNEAKTSASTMPKTRAFFNKLNNEHSQGEDTFTEDQAKELEAKPSVNSSYNKPVTKNAQKPLQASNINNINSKAPTSVSSAPMQSQITSSTNNNSQSKTNVNLQSTSTTPSSKSIVKENTLKETAQKPTSIKATTTQSSATQSQSVTSSSVASQSSTAPSETSKQAQEQWNKQNPILHSLNDMQQKIDASFDHPSKSKDLPNSIEKFEKKQSKKDAQRYKDDTEPGGIYYQSSSASSEASSNAQSGSISYPASNHTITDYSTDKVTTIPVYKTTNNRNYNFAQNDDDDDTNFYQTKFSEEKPDNSIKYQEGNAKVNFSNPIYLNYKAHTKSAHHGDPQSVTTVGNKLDVMFNVNHGDSKSNKNNVDRILQYNAKTGKLTAMGKSFVGAHGQGFTYNPSDKQLWMINNREADNHNPQLIQINPKTLKATKNVMNVQDPIGFGNDLAFDNNGTAYNVIRLYSDNNPLHAPKGSLALSVGHKEGNQYVFHVAQGFHYAPGYVIQNLSYNPYNNRLYVVCNSSIMSFPVNKINHMKASDIKTTKFQHHFEMEDLAFNKNGSMLLMDWPARLLRSSNKF